MINSLAGPITICFAFRYDIILDCTDNVATRYLLNDACVLLGKCLVSGSALRFEGQLTVYHHAGGPCYRCLFPRPPPPGTVTSCSDGGVMGPGRCQVKSTLYYVLHHYSSWHHWDNASFRSSENCFWCWL